MKLLKKFVVSMIIIGMVIIFSSVEGVAATKDTASQRWDGTVGASFHAGDGSQQNPYVISNGKELAKLADDVNKGNSYSNSYFVLADDIDLNGLKWTPIGYWESDTDFSYFKGKFDGKNHTIKNFYIYSRFNGIFGEIENAELKNINIENVADSEHIYCIQYGKTAFIGGLVGYVESNSLVENCTFHGTINGDDSYHNGTVGGIVGFMEGNSRIVNCTNYGTIVKGFRSVGGIVGESHGSVENCVNKGTTTKLSYDIGGIAGRIGKSGEENDVQIINCSNESDFDVENTMDMGADLGGIVGYVYAGKIQMCQNQGKLKGYRIGIGGIAGKIGWIYAAAGETSEIRDCKNVGSISAKGNVGGGICGSSLRNTKSEDEFAAGMILDCVNQGSVTCCVAGGILGDGGIPVVNCYNMGEISSNEVVNSYDKNHVGGILGKGNCQIFNCFNTGKVGTSEKQCDIGGIVGCIDKSWGESESKICNSYHTGTLLGNGNIGALVGYINGIQYSYTVTILQTCFYRGNAPYGSIGKAQYESVTDNSSQIQDLNIMCKNMNMWVAMNREIPKCHFWQITDGTEVSGGYPYYWNGTTSNKINFQVSSLSLKKNDKQQLTVSASLPFMKSELVWGSSDDSIAKVDQNGMVTAMAPGHAVIKCFTSDFAIASCEITVIDVKQNAINQKAGNKEKTTNKKMVPRKPVIKYLVCKKNKKFEICWKKVAGAKGYQLQYATSKKFKAKKTKSTTKTKYTVKKLKKKKTYYVRVRAYTLSNGKKVYGKWSSVKKVKIKK